MAAIPWATAIRAVEGAIKLGGKLWPKKDDSAKKALIAALIASIPVLTKELIPLLIEVIREIFRRGKYKPYYADDADVCHTYEDCTIGAKIKPEHRHRGTGDKELCAECRDRMLGI